MDPCHSRYLIKLSWQKHTDSNRGSSGNSILRFMEKRLQDIPRSHLPDVSNSTSWAVLWLLPWTYASLSPHRRLSDGSHCYKHAHKTDRTAHASTPPDIHSIIRWRTPDIQLHGAFKKITTTLNRSPEKQPGPPVKAVGKVLSFSKKASSVSVICIAVPKPEVFWGFKSLYAVDFCYPLSLKRKLLIAQQMACRNQQSFFFLIIGEL